MRDARSDATAVDGAGNGPNDGGPACIVVNGSGQAWPPTTPSSTKPECVPNCDAVTCGSACSTGMPCVTGCCSANKATINPASTGNFQTPVAAMANDSSGNLYVFLVNGRSYWEETGDPPTRKDSVDYLDCQAPLPCQNQPSCVAGCGDTASPEDPRIAVGGPAANRVVYVTYATNGPMWGNPSLSPGYRLGSKRGTVWTFEDLAFKPFALAADSTGTAWIATEHRDNSTGQLSEPRLYRRSSAKGWDAIPIPCGVVVTSMAFDGSDALYVASPPDKRIWRRDSSGAWGAEAVPGIPDRVVAGAGTIHYFAGRAGASGTDGGRRISVAYGRRSGTTWTEDLAFVHGSDYFPDYNATVDACGAPHIVVTSQDVVAPSYFNWNIYYVRWTAVGWRSGFLTASLDPAGAAIGLTAAYSEFVFGMDANSQYDATVPLR